MAGPPENRTAPVLDAPARRRIGEFYLIQVLKGSDGRVYRRQSVFSDSYDFRAIDSAIALRVLASIPGDLANELGLSKLRWKRAASKNFTLSLLVAGFLNDEEVEIENAISTIELAQKTNGVVNANEYDGSRGQTEPLFLRIAGVHQNQATGDKRIVAATYDLTQEDKPLTQLNISVPTGKWLSSIMKNQGVVDPVSLFLPIPTGHDNPYQNAGLITKAMQSVALASNGLSQHNSALTFKIGSNGDIIVGESQDPTEQSQLYDTFSRLGYYARKESGLITVGFTKEAAENRHLAPWEVSLPAYLQKV